LENDIINKFTSLRPHYITFTERMESLINELLKLSKIKVHLIEARTKSIDSFRKKIQKPEKLYIDPLNELTDLSGIRVIVYYQDDVEKVAQVIKEAFTLIELETSHQSNNYSANEFGYLSLHYIIKLSKKRIALPEWSTYKDLVSEIQIRTVLQHSWAAVSHTLQYKNENEVPKILQRKLFRLAGLFELADEEFLSLRDQTEIEKQNSTNAISKGESIVEINLFTIQEFITQWSGINDLKPYLYELNFKFDDNYEEQELAYYDNIIKECNRLNINTINDLREILNINFENFFKHITDSMQWKVSESFILYLMLIRTHINDFNAKYLVEIEDWGDEIAERVIEGAKKDNKTQEKNKLP